MTAVELLKKDLDAEIKLGTKMVVNWDMYLEMEKQQIIDAAERWKGTDFAEKYYAETYGSKGSDEKINFVEIPQEQLEKERNPNYKYFDTSSQTEISDEEIWKAAESQATFAPSFVRGVEWYREQLKNK